MAADAPIYIDVLAPQDGVVPSKEGNLFEPELVQVVQLIRKLAAPGRAARRRGTGSPEADRPGWATATGQVLAPMHHQFEERRGILIEGARGVGKTSFLRAVRAAVNDIERIPLLPGEIDKPLIYPLPILDPTLVSGDRTFIAAIIVNVLREVERVCGTANACVAAQRDAQNKLHSAVRALHAGLMAENEEVWQKLTSERWQDGRFVDQLLEGARAGLTFAERFEAFARLAADMLGADMLLQPLDDVDLAGVEAYTALEAVRRYLTGPSMLPLVAGNLDQFTAIVWERKLADEKEGLAALGRLTDDHKKNPRLTARALVLRGSAIEHLNKVLRPDQRLTLRPRRFAVLRSGLWRRATHPDLPILAAGKTHVDRLQRSLSLIGRAEALLLPAPSTVVTGALLPLIPENTRSLMLALATLGKLVDGTLGKLAAIDSLYQLNEGNRAQPSMSQSDLAELGLAGPRAVGRRLLSQHLKWSHLGLSDSASLESPTRSAIDQSLVLLYATIWLAGGLERALGLLGRFAHVLPSRSAGPFETEIDDDELGDGVTATALVVRDALRRNGYDLSTAQLSGFILTQHLRSEAKAQISRVAAQIRQSYPRSIAQQEIRNEVTPYIQLQLPVAHHQRHEREFPLLPLSPDRLPVWYRSHADILLYSARTLIPTQTGHVWFVDLLRPLEVVACLVDAISDRVTTAGTSTPTELSDRISRLLPALTADVPSTSLGQDSWVAPHSNSGGYPLNPSQDFGAVQDRPNRLSTALATWYTEHIRTPEGAIPSVGTLAAAHRGWRENARRIVQPYNEVQPTRLPTIGGVLQRGALALFAAAVHAEVGALNGLLQPGSDPTRSKERVLAGRVMEQEWLSFEAYQLVPTFEEDVGAATSEPPPDPYIVKIGGPMWAMLEYVRYLVSPDATHIESEAAPAANPRAWAERYLPLSTALITCPLLRLALSKEWDEALQPLWPVDWIGGRGEPDAFSLLSGIPIIVGQLQATTRTRDELDEQLFAAFYEQHPLVPRPAPEADGRPPAPPDQTGGDSTP